MSEPTSLGAPPYRSAAPEPEPGCTVSAMLETATPVRNVKGRAEATEAERNL
ncbi:hypothetical protein ACIRPX_39885 [Streptomyces sp. NPDC101225]|uniref:hypothetical protein n=1 Tax=Streptomyces sp. NPDC101225 TaxID=3366135 RepID=UPI003814A9C6